MKASTLRALGVKSLREVPKRIPIVTWNWVSAGLGRKRRANNQSRDESEIEIDDVFEHAAFNSEVSFYAETYGRGKQPTRVPKGDTVIDLNEIEGECVENGSSRNSYVVPQQIGSPTTTRCIFKVVHTNYPQGFKTSNIRG